MRLGVPTSTTNDGQTSISNRDDQIVLENGVLPNDNLVLDASASSTDVGDNILLETSDGIDLEDGFQITSDAILFEANTKMYLTI